MHELTPSYYFSDIDLVICGHWPELPLHTLYDELVKSQISKSDEIVVLDKAAVSILLCICKYLEHFTLNVKKNIIGYLQLPYISFRYQLLN